MNSLLLDRMYEILSIMCPVRKYKQRESSVLPLSTYALSDAFLMSFLCRGIARPGTRSTLPTF